MADTTDRLKVLVTDTAPLTPVRWGGPHRIFHLFSNLPEDFEVTYVGLELGRTEVREAQPTKRLREIVVPTTKLFPRIRTVQEKLLAEESFDVYSALFAQHDKPYREAILREARDADILVASHPWGFPVLQQAQKIASREGVRKILVHDAHNCELALTQSILSARSNFLRAPFISAITAGVSRIEGGASRQSTLNTVCSEQDAVDLEAYYGGRRDRPSRLAECVVLPNAVKERVRRTEKLQARARGQLDLEDDGMMALFVGAYYRPNVEALESLIDLAHAFPQIGFHVAGSISSYQESHPEPRALPENMIMHGVVNEEKLDHLLGAADIALNPNHSGGGIQIKMLDYLSAGVPVLSSPHGARGLPVQNGDHLQIVDVKDFHHQLKSFVADRDSWTEAWKQPASRGQDVINQKFGARSLGQELGLHLLAAWQRKGSDYCDPRSRTDIGDARRDRP